MTLTPRPLEVDAVLMACPGVGMAVCFAGPSENYGEEVFAAVVPKVRKTPSWPRSWANFSLLWLCYHRDARANLCILWANLTPLSLKEGVTPVVTEGDVKAFVAERLAKEKVPTRVFISDDVPRTATGKIQRRMLKSF